MNVWLSGSTQVVPLEPDDPVDAMFVLYVYRESSRYNRRFEQRRVLKELLGPHRRVVERAKGKFMTRERFVSEIADEEAAAIRETLGIGPGEFWRAARGRAFMDFSSRQLQLDFDVRPGG